MLIHISGVGCIYNKKHIAPFLGIVFACKLLSTFQYHRYDKSFHICCSYAESSSTSLIGMNGRIFFMIFWRIIFLIEISLNSSLGITKKNCGKNRREKTYSSQTIISGYGGPK